MFAAAIFGPWSGQVRPADWLTRTENMEFPKVLAVASALSLRTVYMKLRKHAYRNSARCLAKNVLTVAVALCVCAAAESRRPTQITALKVDVLQEKIEIRIEANRDFSMQSTVLSHPDRIVLDAAGAISKVKQPEISINAGPVKAVRIALLQRQPPVTRIVVDSSMPLPYSFRTEHNSVFLEITLQPPPTAPVATVAPPLPPRVIYERGLLTIAADNSTLAEILEAIHSRIGGTTEFPAAAASERATVHLGPAPLVSVLSALLLGSPFDYVIVGSGQEPGGMQIVLSEKSVHPENPQPPGETMALASAPQTTLVNNVGGFPVPVPPADGNRQPDDGTAPQLINLPPVGAMAAEEASPPPTDESGLDSQSPDAQPRQQRPSKETPRMPPPGKGH